MGEYLTIILFILGGVLAAAQAILGWFARTLWDAVQSLKTDLSKLQLEFSQEYVQKEDFKDFAQQVVKKLDRIENKLDTKADK